MDRPRCGYSGGGCRSPANGPLAGRHAGRSTRNSESSNRHSRRPFGPDVAIPSASGPGTCRPWVYLHRSGILTGRAAPTASRRNRTDEKNENRRNPRTRERQRDRGPRPQRRGRVPGQLLPRQPRRSCAQNPNCTRHRGPPGAVHRRHCGPAGPEDTHRGIRGLRVGRAHGGRLVRDRLGTGSGRRNGGRGQHDLSATGARRVEGRCARGGGRPDRTGGGPGRRNEGRLPGRDRGRAASGQGDQQAHGRALGCRTVPERRVRPGIRLRVWSGLRRRVVPAQRGRHGAGHASSWTGSARPAVLSRRSSGPRLSRTRRHWTT